jgi:hypothetical protein
MYLVVNEVMIENDLVIIRERGISFQQDILARDCSWWRKEVLH